VIFGETSTQTVDLSQINPDSGGEYFQGSLSLDKRAVQWVFATGDPKAAVRQIWSKPIYRGIIEV